MNLYAAVGARHNDLSEEVKLNYDLRSMVAKKIIEDKRTKSKPKRKINRADVFYEVCKYFGVNHISALSANRFREFVNCKKVYTWIMSRDEKYTLKMIGEYIGKDHATILYYKDFCQGQLDINSSFAKHILKIEQIIDNKFYF